MDQDQFAALLKLKCNNAIADSRKLGEPAEIRELIAGFQKYPYDTAA